MHDLIKKGLNKFYFINSYSNFSYMKIIFIILFLFLSKMSFSQSQYDWIYLDTTIIKYDNSFDTEDFINIMLDDTSFYKSFKNLFLFEHKSTTNIKVYSKDDLVKSSLLRKANHYHISDTSWISIGINKHNGKYYNRKGENNYYTGSMFDKVFFPKDSFYYPDNLAYNPYEQKEWNSKTEKHYEQLKRFVFAPGTEVEGVPLIGDKLNIFSPEMRNKYNFIIKLENYKGISCYSFTCSVKENLDEDDVVITYLKSYFDRETFSVLNRDYHIKHNTVLFDFDIFISVDLIKDMNMNYLPTKIIYKGWWKVPLKKAEIMDVKMINVY